MAEILLPSGLIALVDDEDLPLTVGYRWYSDKRGTNTYVRGYPIGSWTNPVYLHRIIKGGANW